MLWTPLFWWGKCGHLSGLVLIHGWCSSHLARVWRNSQIVFNWWEGWFRLRLCCLSWLLRLCRLLWLQRAFGSCWRAPKETGWASVLFVAVELGAEIAHLPLSLQCWQDRKKTCQFSLYPCSITYFFEGEITSVILHDVGIAMEYFIDEWNQNQYSNTCWGAVFGRKHGSSASVQNKTLLWNEQLKSIDFLSWRY